MSMGAPMSIVCSMAMTTRVCVGKQTWHDGKASGQAAWTHILCSLGAFLPKGRAVAS